MKSRLLLWVCLLVVAGEHAQGQTVVVTDDSTNLSGAASAVLDVKSVTKGMLVPRVTAAQKAAIASPATGLLVYQTDGTNGFYYYDGSSWVIINSGGGSASQWTTTGNDIYYNTGLVGIGTSSPGAPLHVKKATPTTGTVTVGVLEGIQDAGAGNGVYAQIKNSSASSSRTGLVLGGATSDKQWLIGNDSAGNNIQNFYLYDMKTGTARLYIDSAGHVALGGGTAPTEALDVTGNVKFSGAVMPGNDPGTLGYVLTSGGTGGTPTWTDPNSYISSGWQLNGNTLSSVKKFGTLSYHDIPFVTNNVEKMRLMADGKLGIGKSNPTEILDVVGNVRFSGALMPNNSYGTSGQFLMSSGYNTAPTWADAWKPGGNNLGSVQNLGTTSYTDIPIITANTERMRIKSDGKVGIGTASPTQVLDVTGNVQFSGALMPGSSNGTAGQFLISAGANTAPTWGDAWKPDGNNISGTKSIGTTSYSDLPFITNNTEKMRIKADGKVGIGTTNPGEILDVTGNVNVTGNVYATGNIKLNGALMPNNSAGTSGYFLTSAGSGQPPTWTNPSTLAWTPGGNTLSSTQNFGTVSYHDIPIITANSEKVRIKADGKVGIGTTNPGQLLDVSGNVSFSGALMPNNSAGTSGFFLTSAGTNQPPTWTDPSTLAWKPGGNTFSSVQNFGTASYHDIPIITANTEKMRIKADGKVGIGKTAPTEILDVVGNVRFSGALMPNNSYGNSGQVLISAGMNNPPVWGDAWTPGGNNLSSMQSFGTTSYTDIPFITANTEKMRLLANGRLGIGTTSPGEMLDVVGNVKFSGALMPNNSYGTAGQFLMSAGMNTAPTWADAWKPGGNTIYSIQTLGTNAYTDLPFVTNSTERMRITAAGNVGINNTNPSQPLDVTGNVRFSGALMPNNTAGTSGYILTSAGNNTAPTWTDPSASFWKQDGNSLSAVKKLGTTSNHYLPFITNNTERMRIETNGEVGIGTTSPTATLDVAGTVKLGTAGTAFTNIIKTSVTISNTSNVTTSNPLEVNVTVTGAQLNGTVIVNPRADLTNRLGIAYAYVSATNTVRIVFNTTNGTIQLGSNKDFDITVINP